MQPGAVFLTHKYAQGVEELFPIDLLCSRKREEEGDRFRSAQVLRKIVTKQNAIANRRLLL